MAASRVTSVTPAPVDLHGAVDDLGRCARDGDLGHRYEVPGDLLHWVSMTWPAWWHRSGVCSISSLDLAI